MISWCEKDPHLFQKFASGDKSFGDAPRPERHLAFNDNDLVSSHYEKKVPYQGADFIKKKKKAPNVSQARKIKNVVSCIRENTPNVQKNPWIEYSLKKILVTKLGKSVKAAWKHLPDPILRCCAS